MKIFRKLRAVARLNRRKQLDQRARKRVQLREFGGELYIALDGIPVQKVYQEVDDVIITLNEVRATVRAYLQREK